MKFRTQCRATILIIYIKRERERERPHGATDHARTPCGACDGASTSGRPLRRRVGRPVRSLSQLRRLYGAPPLPGRDLVLFDLGESEPLRARAHGHASEGQFRWSGVVRRVVMGLPRALALGCLVKNLPDQGNIVVSSRQHCRASRAASGHLYGLVEWKMLSASLASSFHLEFGRLVPLLDASPPMPRVGFALRCARAWERAQRSTLSGVGELVARRLRWGRERAAPTYPESE